MRDDDDIDDHELVFLLSEEGRKASAADAARSKGGRRHKGSQPGLSGKERKAAFDRRRRMLEWAAAFTELAGRLSRERMCRLEALRILPDAFLAALDQEQEDAVRDWKLITGRNGGPETWKECLALQAWRGDRAQRPPAGPPRNFPTSRYEENWLYRLEKQIAGEDRRIGGRDFDLDFQHRQSLKRALNRPGPVKNLRLRSGKTRPAVTAYAAGAARAIEPTPDLKRQYLERLKKKRPRRK
jgi:hypothetical protein